MPIRVGRAEALRHRNGAGRAEVLRHHNSALRHRNSGRRHGVYRTGVASMLVALFVCAGASAAEREWQNGTWREYKVERPRVLFGTQTRDPNSNLPRTAAAREVRLYVIDTRTHRLELRQDATADTPRIDVLVGEPVTLAIEKRIVYIKDGDGKEHRLSLRKQTELEK